MRVTEIVRSHALPKLLECYVECSIHFLFIFWPTLSGKSLNTNFRDAKYYCLGAWSPGFPLDPRWVLSKVFSRISKFIDFDLSALDLFL